MNHVWKTYCSTLNTRKKYCGLFGQFKARDPVIPSFRGCLAWFNKLKIIWI